MLSSIVSTTSPGAFTYSSSLPALKATLPGGCPRSRAAAESSHQLPQHNASALPASASHAPTQPAPASVHVTISLILLAAPHESKAWAQFASSFKWTFAAAVSIAACKRGAPTSAPVCNYTSTTTSPNSTIKVILSFSYPTSLAYVNGVALVVADPPRWFSQVNAFAPSFKVTDRAHTEAGLALVRYRRGDPVQVLA